MSENKAIKKLKDLTPDDLNPNDGTERGTGLLEDSLREYGAGRSILLDKKGRIIAGNKTVEAAGSLNMDDLIVVPTDGTKIVAVQRMDLDLDDPKTREMAIADNRIAEVNIQFNPEVVAQLEDLGANVAKFWTGAEMEIMAQNVGQEEGGDGEAPERTVECPSCHHEFVPPKGNRAPRMKLRDRIRRANPQKE